MDSTVLPANILYPNDVLLLWKALKKMQRVATAHHTELNWDHPHAKQRWRAFNLDKKTPLATYLAEFFALFQGALASWHQQAWPEVARWLPLLTYWPLKLSRN